MKKRLTVTKIISFLCIALVVGFGPDAHAKQRVRFSINTTAWKFKEGDVKNASKPAHNDKDWLRVTIPHDFNGGSDGKHFDVFKGRFDFKNDPDKRMMYTGPAWYRTEFTIEEQHKGKRVFIEFEAVSLEARVWVNGRDVGRHQGGYTAFSFDITDQIKFGTSNVLAVRADNSNNPKIAPWMKNEKQAFPFSFDYAIYGGIYRDVWISVTDPVKIEKVFNTPLTGGQAPTSLTVETRVKNYSKKSKDVELVTEILDPQHKSVSRLTSKKTIPAGGTAAFTQYESAMGDVQYWDVKHPNIYTVHSTISYDGKAVDDYESVFGVRYFTYANNQAFSLNGKKFLLRGINRHQDMEGLGYALPNEQHRADARIMKDAGFNFVRHAHYPCDPEFTKACDELGMMLWLEIPLTGSTSDDPAFLENCRTQLTEMIEQHYNNPSVVVWGIGNESDRSGASEAVSNAVFSALVKTAKAADQTRPVTGCNFVYESNQKIVDVYSPQDWSGWYSGSVSEYKPASIIGEYGADIHVTNHTEQKFRIDSNYTAAQKPGFWSQEYGALIHEYKVSLGESRADEFPGHCVWVAFDFASPRADRISNPLPFMNQKGLLLHDHTTKKDAYFFYQSTYRTADEYPMVHIVSHSWTDRWTQPAKKDVWVYSNCDSVELFNDLGTVSFGTRTKNAGPRGDTRFQWDMADVKYNVLFAQGWFKNQIVARDTIVLQHLPAKK